MKLLATAVSSLGLAVVNGCGGERSAPVPDFVSPEVCTTLGHAQATAYATQHLPQVTQSHTLPSGAVLERQRTVLEALAAAREAVVRLAVTYDREGATRTSHGSGVLVEGGRFVLTAGHALADMNDPNTADLRFYVPRPAHESDRPDLECTARLVAWRYGRDEQGLMQDWALLEVVSPPEGMPHVRTATAGTSAVLFCYGFPAQLGIDAHGKTVPWQAQRRLEPVLTVVSPLREDPVGAGMPLCRPLAGCLSAGGQSGGPVFDAHGALVYLIAGNNSWWNDGRHTHFIRVAPLDAALAALAAVRK